MNRLSEYALAIEVRPAGKLPMKLRSELELWFDKQFARTGILWARPGWYILARHGTRIVGRIGIFRRTITVGKREIRVGGLGGVITRERWCRRGVAAHMLVTAERVMRDVLRCEYGLLLCAQDVVPVYEGAGWKLVDGPTSFMQGSSKLTYRNLTMVLQLGKSRWPAGPINFRGLPW
jgi:hypothetical protein